MLGLLSAPSFPTQTQTEEAHIPTDYTHFIKTQPIFNHNQQKTKELETGFHSSSIHNPMYLLLSSK